MSDSKTTGFSALEAIQRRNGCNPDNQLEDWGVPCCSVCVCADDVETTEPNDCLVPPLSGDRPTTRCFAIEGTVGHVRCDPCPYHGYIRIRERQPDGRWEIRYERL